MKRNLSDREFTILRHMTYGFEAKEIARKLDITDATVKVHKKAIYRKMGARNSSHAVAIAFRNGWFPATPGAAVLASEYGPYTGVGEP